MFPNNPTVALSAREAPAETRQALSQLIKPGESAPARVVSVTPNPAQPTQHKIQLEVEGKLIQLLSTQKPAGGTQAQIGLTQDGKVTLQISRTPAQQTPSRATATATTTQLTPPHTSPATNKPSLPQQVAMQISTGQALPLKQDQPVKAVVISSTQATPQPQAPKAAAQTYTRPIVPQPSVQQSATAASVSPPTAPTATSADQAAPGRPVAQNLTSSQPAPPGTPMPPASGTSNNHQTTPPAPQNPSLPSAGTNAGKSAEPVRVTTVPTPPQAPTPPKAQVPNTTPAQTGTTPSVSAPPTPAAPTTPVGSKTSLQNAPARTNVFANTTSAQQTGNASAESPVKYIVQMQIAGQKPLQLQSPTPLPAQTPVVLTLTQNNQVSATITTGNVEQANSQLRDAATIQEALRTALPSQQPVAESLSQLQSVSQQSSAQVSTLVRSMLSLFGVRPGAENSARQIQTNVESGGLQTEARLIQGKLDGKQDMKGLIRQLQQHVNDAPPDVRPKMEQLIQSVQSRITHNQLQSLAQSKETPDGGFERVLQLDLPIIHNQRLQTVDLRISEEGHHSGDQATTTRWRVRLHFDLDSLGEVDAEIQLTAEEEINIRFWCAEQSTQQHISQQLDTFEVQLNQKGFKPAELVCYLGEAPNSNADTLQKNLVDIHT